MECLDADQVATWLTGDCSAAESLRLEGHVRECEPCRELLADVARMNPLELSARDLPERSDLPGTPPPRAPAVLRRGATVAGRYVVLDLVGVGGMGVVYAAYDPKIDRRVALKLVRPGEGLGAERARREQERILREARLLGRLSHPNVVVVYDVGAEGDQVFMAMEFVAGRTLRRWLDERPDQAQVLRTFRGAARGLLAAHEAGVVHGDFKPENVLLGEDGRARVTDLGLARAVAPAAPGPGEAPGAAAAAVAESKGSAAAGTPSYMAPEQYRGEAATAASDQYAFCVALCEALYGERPFAGADPRALAAAALSGQPRAPQIPGAAPRWLRALLLRGLQPDPAERFPSMAELVEALGGQRRRPWAGAAIGLSLLPLVVAGGLQLRGGPGRRPCDDGDLRLAGIWDGPRREEIRQALLRSGAPRPEAAFGEVARRLDDYSGAWSREYRAQCLALQRPGGRSTRGLQRSADCLERRFLDLRVLSKVLAAADRDVAARAGQLAASLPQPALCMAETVVENSSPDPEDGALRDRVHQLRARLSEALLLGAARKGAQAVALARAAQEEARALLLPPFHAEALFVQGTLEQQAGDYAAAERTLSESLFTAQASRNDWHAMESLMALSKIVGWYGGRYREGYVLARQAEAFAERLDNDRARCRAALVVTNSLEQQGRWKESIRILRRVLSLREKGGVSAVEEVATAASELGAALVMDGQYAEAEIQLRRALQLRRAQGPDSSRTAGTLGMLAGALEGLGRDEEALALHDEALALRTRLLGAQHQDLAVSLSNRAGVLRGLGRLEEARRDLARALAIFRSTLGEVHHAVPEALAELAQTELQARRPRQALAYSEEALLRLSQAQSAPTPVQAAALLAAGQSLLALGRDDEAARQLERGLAVPGDFAWQRAELRAALAPLLLRRGDRERAAALARDAAADYPRCGPRGRRALGRLRAFCQQAGLPLAEGI